jgi:hypothetical protein
MSRTHYIEKVWGSENPANVFAPDLTKQGNGYGAVKPPHQEFNYIENRNTGMLLNAEQHGIMEWNENTLFPLGGLSKGSDGTVYRSRIPGNAGFDPVGDVVRWEDWLAASALSTKSVPLHSLTETYGLNEVLRGSDGFLYVSQQGANVGNEPTTDDGTWWTEYTLFIGQNPAVRAYVATHIYSLADGNRICDKGGKLWVSQVASNADNDPEIDDGTNWIEYTTSNEIGAIALFEDRKANGVAGDVYAAGDDTRIINYEAVNNITGVSLSSNQITLPADLECKIEVTASITSSDNANLRLRTISGDALSIVGSNMSSRSITPTFQNNHLMSYVKTTQETIFDITQHAAASNTSGTAVGNGVHEIYLQIMITKIG